jgi:sarcosine oxidase
MGAAAAYQLAKRGTRVLGLDRHAPPHSFGSSHGDTRITRLAIGEGAHYTPLAIRSHEIWREIERETGEDLLTTNGGLIISSPDATASMHVEGFFANTVGAAERFGIVHERLDAAQIRARFPQFAVADDEYGYLERNAGFIRPEACIRAQLALARKHGAEIHTGETANDFAQTRDGVTVTSDKGTYAASKLVISAGPWLPQLLSSPYAAPFKVSRQVLYWFDVDGPIAPWLPENCPIFIWDLRDRREGVYGFPAVDGPRGGVKIATEQYLTTTTPEAIVRDVTPEEVAHMHARYVAPYFPSLAARCVKAVTCLYTVTPDFGFVIDRHPEMDRVIVASPCSGHGFKHSAAIGEALAGLALDGQSRFDLSAFGFARFSVGP